MTWKVVYISLPENSSLEKSFLAKLQSLIMTTLFWPTENPVTGPKEQMYSLKKKKNWISSLVNPYTLHFTTYNLLFCGQTDLTHFSTPSPLMKGRQPSTGTEGGPGGNLLGLASSLMRYLITTIKRTVESICVRLIPGPCTDWPAGTDNRF